MSWNTLYKLSQNVVGNEVNPPVAPVAPHPIAPQPVQTTPVAPVNELGAGVRATITTNQYNKKFLVLVGNSAPLHKAINLGLKGGLGFKFFQGTWSKRLDMLTDQDKQVLQSNGVDLSVLNRADDPAYDRPAADPNAPKTPASEQIAAFKKKIEEEMAGSGAGNEVKSMLNHVEKTLDQLANSVDEAAKKEFIRSFLAFSSKFWNYSWHNALLIYLQKRSATYVRGFRQWMEMGRQVNNWDNGIVILAPMYKKYKDENTADPNNPKERTVVFFRAVKVYDISDTQPIPNWKDKNGNGPFEGTPQLKTENEENEHVNVLVQAASAFARRVGVTVDLGKELPDNLGGYSTGGGITVNKNFKGIAQFGTLIHEIAHEVLHWDKDRPTFLPKEQMRQLRQEREIDAESAAYIVLKHYGFESKDAPNYLALWQAGSKEVKNRRDHIVNAVKVIIRGLEDEMGKVVQVPDEEQATETNEMPPATAANWFQRVVLANKSSMSLKLRRMRCRRGEGPCDEQSKPSDFPKDDGENCELSL